ncbi:DUF4013 domain-containing protein [Methanosphaerula palustris]|nr:DUF4013 domain-containing protein [Methanosphaerula palustris]
MISDAFEYTREALVGKWVRWVLLTIVSIIPIVNFIFFGYVMEIYRGTKPAPELENWGTLFVDGLKLFIVMLIYAIPVLVILAIFGGISFLSMIASGNANADPTLIAGAIASLMGGILLALIVGLIIAIIAVIGTIRFTRTGSFGEAFNFSAILETIGSIGWVDYIISLVILFVVLAVVQFVLGLLMVIPVLGWIISFFITAAMVIFEARYMTLLYDSA